MSPIRRRLRAAAFVLSALAAAGAPALAQNETSNTIGPPQLKDFSLPGRRTTPPATPTPVPDRPPAAPVRTPPAATPAPVPAPAREPAARTLRPDSPGPRTGPAPVSAMPAPATPEAATEPQASAPPAAEIPPTPVPEPEVAPTAPLPVPAPAPSTGSGRLWPMVGVALLVALAGLFFLRRRRARVEHEVERDSARGELGDMLLGETDAPPAPVPAPQPEPDPIPEVPAAPRPWIELDIVPERAAATENEVYVRYALTMTNKGDCDARNIRIDPRLFNAGAEGEMAAFFQGPIHDQSGSPHIVLQPGRSIRLNGQVALPNAELREIELSGRRIFVPMVAINVAYDWAGGGAGRTSRSWLVGREAEVPTDKMGPFRLDLGPRIYRSVGRREARQVMV